MKILTVDPEDILQDKIREISCTLDEVGIISHKDLGSASPGSLGVDVVIGTGDFSRHSPVGEVLLKWRTHPETYLVPCWIGTNRDTFEKCCLWPALTVDRFGEQMEASCLCDWLAEVADWQQNRMHVGVSHSFSEHSPLELLTSLSLRRASGTLTVFDQEGNQGRFHLLEGSLSGAELKHLRDEEAFGDLLSWTAGSYHWEPNGSASGPSHCGQPLERLIAQGLQLIRDANLLFHFLSELGQKISRTESEAALDDGAVPYFQQIRKLYHLIEGDMSARDVIEISPLSKPRTMNALAKWLSLGDLQSRPLEDQPRKHRLLIVDDSKLMCRALETVFSKDPRFEIVGIGHDGYEAIRLIEEREPDAVTLDIQMPNMDGLTALKHIMIRNPKPVVILSAFTKETSRLTYDSFKYGAVDVFAKPSAGTLEEMARNAEELRNRIIQASCVRIEAAQYIRRAKAGNTASSSDADQEEVNAGIVQQRVIITLCGTGGFPSLLKLLLSLPRSQSLPPIVACMALSEKVVEALMPNLQKDSQLRIQEAQDEAPLTPGTCYLYSHECRYQLEKIKKHIHLKASANGNGKHRPFDTLLYSATEALGDQTVAVLISGTGEDGVDGLRCVRQAGGQALVLSPRACLKPELPQLVLDQGYAREVRTPCDLANLLEGYPRSYPAVGAT
ncbi:MAG: response regulator [Deltaproteobacteria bacterium]|nr:response regulator [Deltaproteobacteria bacterium]